MTSDPLLHHLVRQVCHETMPRALRLSAPGAMVHVVARYAPGERGRPRIEIMPPQN